MARGDDLVLTREEGVPRVLADDIREEWRLLWSGSIDDKVRAEDLASKSFSLLFVERVLGSCPSVGGWTKFAKTVLNKQSRARRFREELPKRKLEKNMQLKQCGRGWLHL